MSRTEGTEVPGKSLAIWNALDELHERSSALSNQVTELKSRLDPVMRGEELTSDEAKDKAKPITEMNEILENIGDNIKFSKYNLNDIMDRLEL